MRTIQEILAELRALAAKGQQGQDVTAQRQQAEQELAQLGYVPAGQMDASHPLVQAAAHTLLKNTHGGSRFAGPNSDPAALAHLAAGGSFGASGEQMQPGGYRVSEPPAGKTANLTGGTLAGAMTKALAQGTPSAGGVLVPEEVSAEIVQLVRNRVAVAAMPGVREVPVRKELDLPYISTGSAAYYVQENARIPVSEPTFALVPKLVPIELAALVPVSNRLLRNAQTQPEFEAVLRSDMADAIAGRQDLAFLQGLGGGNEPLGIRNQAGLTPSPSLGANGGRPELSHFQRMVGGLRAANAPFQRPGWIFHPNVLTYLETLTDTTGRPLLDAGLLSIDQQGGGGTFLHYPFRTTGRIPTTLRVGTSEGATYAVFGSDWNECWIGVDQELVIDASGEATYSPDGGTTHISAFQQRQTVFRAVTSHDVALRRPEFFTVSEGILV